MLLFISKMCGCISIYGTPLSWVVFASGQLLVRAYPQPFIEKDSQQNFLTALPQGGTL
jgi:hypothetical protein